MKSLHAALGGLACTALCLPLLSRSAPAAGAVPSLNPGDVIITEFMKDPAAVSDANGEWFELHNLLPWRVDIEGLRFQSGSQSFVIDNGGAGVWIGPNGWFVLGNEADPTMNGGVSVDYEYSSFTLGNGADDIRVQLPSGVFTDIVRYADGPAWPDSSGQSICLDPSGFDRWLNDDPAFWCHSASIMSGGDTGTPGAPNDGCP